MKELNEAEKAGLEIEQSLTTTGMGRVYVFLDWGDATAPACGSGAFLSDAVVKFRWTDRPFDALLGTDGMNGETA